MTCTWFSETPAHEVIGMAMAVAVEEGSWRCMCLEMQGWDDG